MTDQDLGTRLLYRFLAVVALVVVMGAVSLLGGCVPAACATVAALEAAPAPESGTLTGLLLRMGRELALTSAREKCRE